MIRAYVIERFRIGKKGYWLLRLDRHPFFPGKTIELEHRVIVAERLGRRLRKGEIVHHKIGRSNRPSNLVLKRNQKAHFHDHHRAPCSLAKARRISAAKRGKPQPWAKGPRGFKRSAAFRAKVSKTMRRYRAAIAAGRPWVSNKERRRKRLGYGDVR